MQGHPELYSETDENKRQNPIKQCQGMNPKSEQFFLGKKKIHKTLSSKIPNDLLKEQPSAIDGKDEQRWGKENASHDRAEHGTCCSVHLGRRVSGN